MIVLTYFYFLSFVGTRPALQRRAAVKLCYRPAGAAELEPSTATPAALPAPGGPSRDKSSAEVRSS